ncbi:MAG: HupE/UreJ family protein [Kofleriaceae bacterium]
MDRLVAIRAEMFRRCSRLAGAAPCDRRSVRDLASRALVIVVLLARIAAAHQSSTKYVDVRVDAERAEVTLRCEPGDLTEPLQLAPNAKPTAAIAAASAKVPAYVASWLALRVPTERGPVTCIARDRRARAEDDGFVAVTWSVTCARPIELLILDFSAFFTLDRRMEALVRIGDDTDSIRVTAAENPIALDVAPHPLFEFTPERLAFAMLIVLVAALARRFRDAAREAAILLAIYELAHVAGALGWIMIPTALAQVILPATVIYAALEVAFRPDVRWRAITFGVFGLVHGIAHPHALIADLGTALVTTAGALLVVLPLARTIQRRIWLAGAICAFGGVWLLQVVLARL